MRTSLKAGRERRIGLWSHHRRPCCESRCGARGPPALLERELPNTVPGIGHVEHGASRIEPKRRRRDMFTDRSPDLRPMRAAVGGVEEALAVLKNGGPNGILIERIDSER